MERILVKFPSNFSIELSVLDGSGDPFEVYAGPVVGLAAGHLSNVLRDAGCFYVFTVIGIPRELVNAVDMHYSNIRRAEFLWLTEPAAPYLVNEKSNSVVLGWTGYRFCGVDPYVPPENLRYVLEMAEGCEWKDGKLAKFMTDLTVKSYHRLLTVHEPKSSLVVGDLQPGMCYFARIAIEFLGDRVVSEPLCFHTSPSNPSAPEMPRAYVAPATNCIDPSFDYPPNIVLNWSGSNANGDQILKYQVMMQQVMLSSHFVESDEPYSPLFAKKLKHVRSEKRVLRGGQWVKQRKADSHPAPPPTYTQPVLPQYRDHVVVFTQWIKIYSNLDRKVKLTPPPAGAVEWRFKVRAKNSCGWSDFSPILFMHNRSNPALFKSEYPSDYDGDGLSLCSYAPSSPAPLHHATSTISPSAQTNTFQETLSAVHRHQQQQQQQQQNIVASNFQRHQQAVEAQQYCKEQFEEVYTYDEELIEASDQSSGFALGRPRATSALPSTSHDRRESFSSDAGGGISAPNSRVIGDTTEYGLDTHSGLLSGDRTGLGSRGRSAGARLPDSRKR